MWRLLAAPAIGCGVESHGKHADSTVGRSLAACGHGLVPVAECGFATLAATVANREALARLHSSGPDHGAGREGREPEIPQLGPARISRSPRKLVIEPGTHRAPSGDLIVVPAHARKLVT